MIVTALQGGSFRLFRFLGIEGSIHWSWFVVALFEINNRRDEYSVLGWNVAEYVVLFGIVLLHEFGHALACRQVGGQANRIVLWPLGGVAFVSPPQRPGATLWAIAAGPLVNAALLPLAFALALIGQSMGWGEAFPDGQRFLWTLVYINAGLLIFNLLPIYPLDGGQILRSLLWFWLGRARSLSAAAVIGFAGALGLLALAFFIGSIWIGIVAFFILSNCWRTWGQAKILSRMDALPHREQFACPVCHAAPPLGPFWICPRCQARFDTFETGATCPNCQEHFGVTACVHCGSSRPMAEWSQPPKAQPEKEL